MGVLLCAVTKSCGQVRALITLSSWPCCRGGARACVVCAYLGGVTWAGRKVTITIRLLYPRSILCQAPPMRLYCPAAQNATTLLRKTRQWPPPHTSGMRATRNVRQPPRLPTCEHEERQMTIRPRSNRLGMEPTYKGLLSRTSSPYREFPSPCRKCETKATRTGTL